MQQKPREGYHRASCQVDTLSKREDEVMQEIIKGKTSEAIAQTLSKRADSQEPHQGNLQSSGDRQPGERRSAVPQRKDDYGFAS